MLFLTNWTKTNAVREKILCFSSARWSWRWFLLVGGKTMRTLESRALCCMPLPQLPPVSSLNAPSRGTRVHKEILVVFAGERGDWNGWRETHSTPALSEAIDRQTDIERVRIYTRRYIHTYIQRDGETHRRTDGRGQQMIQDLRIKPFEASPLSWSLTPWICCHFFVLSSSWCHVAVHH